MARFEDILPLVERPARYVGGEVNAVVKPQAAGRIALCFPDLYEIGMSHLGLKILYSVVNAEPDLAAERCFAPWSDLAAQLRSHGFLLPTLETRTPLRECDVVGFSLQYELSYTNVLEMLDLGGIPIHREDRGDPDPLVLAGGPCVFNPESMADFFDAFLIGDAEDALVEIVRVAAQSRRRGAPRSELLATIAAMRGVYVPSAFETTQGRFVTVAGARVAKRTIRKLDAFPFPAETVVPNVPATHDRVAVEIMRGCPQRCRFCQAGVIYRPTRFRDPNSVIETGLESLACTGHDEIGLSSLSAGDYPYLEAVSEILMHHVGSKKTSLSLSSLRASAVNENLSFQISRGKRTGFTIAPEAGSQRMRDCIAKNISEEMIMNGCHDAFAMGWQSLKLYFMIGLPTETMEDVDAIVTLAQKIVRTHPGKAVTVSVSSFVPKPHTPFQWCAQDSMALLREKQERLREGLRRVRGTRFKYHQVEMSHLEAVISRGDRRVGRMIERAWRLGQTFDGWTEKFNYERWMDAAASAAIDCSVYTAEIGGDESLPWDHVDTTITKAELRKEWERAVASTTTLSCLELPCRECQACGTREGDFLRLKRIELVPPPEPTVAAEPSAAPPSAGGPPKEPLIYRGFFEKKGPAAFLSHLDLGHVLRMAFRRSGLKIAFTQGYSPLPKFSYGPPLPVGVEGFREVLDFGLSEPVDPMAALSSLNCQMPEGLKFTRVHAVPGVKSHLARDLLAAVYETEPVVMQLQVNIAGRAAGDRCALRAAHEAGDRLFLLVHPEARVDVVLKEASGVSRPRAAFKRTAIVLQGEDWMSLVPGTHPTCTACTV
ncbi:MAG: TIGR03960 family B12-binding radical SAM protein [Acidobacteria bacterium]|nr:TIGR03960 family B12-binding radical SAM protein [Acidobacteriota bacterium]